MNHRNDIHVGLCSILLTLPFFLGCASAAPVANVGPPPDEPEAFRFDWSAPCRVPVVERVEKEGNTMRFSFVLDVQPAGDKLHVRSDELRLLSINGVDLTATDAPRELTPGMALDAAVTMEVSQAGEFLGAIGLEDEIENELAEESPDADPEKHAALTKLMRSPEMRAMVESKVADRWETWVGAWVGFGPRPGAPRRAQMASILFGASVPMVLVREHLGKSTAFPGLSHLRITSTVDAEKSPQALESAIVFLAQQVDSPRRLPDPHVRTFEKVSVYEVHTDPATLRPARARWMYTMRIDMGEGVRTSRELRDASFDWAHAQGCALTAEAR